MKIPTLTAILFTWAALVSAQPKLAVTDGALSHDYGEVRRDQKLMHKITLRNEGNATAQLKRIQKSCGGCSPIELPRDRIPPGESVTLTLRFESGTRRGEQTRKLYVLVSDSKTSNTMEIAVKWNVKAFLECIPEKIDLGKKRYAVTQDVRILLDVEGLKPPVAVTAAKCASPHVRVGAPQSVEGGRRIVVPVSILPTAPAGPFQSEIVIETNYPKEPRLVVPVIGTIQGPFLPKERYINYGFVAVGKPAQRKTEITQSPGASFQITGVEYDKSVLSCRLTEEKKRYYLEASLLPDLKPTTVRTTVTLCTTCPVQEKVRLPVLAVIR